MYGTHRLMVIHPCAKYGKPMSNHKKVMGRTRICTDRRTDGQTDRRTDRQTDRQSDFYIYIIKGSLNPKKYSKYWLMLLNHVAEVITCRKSEDKASLRYSLDSSTRTEECRICRNSSWMKWRAWLRTHLDPWGSELQDKILSRLSRDSPSAIISSQPTGYVRHMRFSHT